MTDRLVAEFRPDAVIASSTYPMDIWVARRIAKKADAKLVYEVHDLWPLSPIELSGMSPRHPFALLCQAAEDAAYRDANKPKELLDLLDRASDARELAACMQHLSAAQRQSVALALARDGDRITATIQPAANAPAPGCDSPGTRPARPLRHRARQARRLLRLRPRLDDGARR